VTTPFLCVLVAFVLAYAPILVQRAQARKGGDYDNRHPRAHQLEREGLGARALAAHLNGLEGLAGFAPAVFVAHLGHADPRRTSVLAIAYVVSRAVYIGLYLADIPSLRSAVWWLGFLVTLALFLLPLAA
jgi:uncharacterized MAPEG superfamily protein